ncbi:MAG: CHAD domain-containing protein [Acidimicrobiaceae bacterium]|jgi:CHAD domain-containing protein|nr:CHAD domain-containing protein [Acidimicrobiaceae bacterium]
MSKSELDTSLSGGEVVTRFIRREVKSIAYNEPLAHENLDTEGVHQLRVSARRLRSELRAMRSVLPREPWRELSEDLKWMGAVLGELRDLDVLSELLSGHLVLGTTLHDTVMAALDERRRRRHRDVLEMLESKRYARIVQRLGQLSRHPGLGDMAKIPAAELFVPVLWGASCTYFERIGDPSQRRSDDGLHQVRIATKKCRYNFEIAALFLGENAHEVAQKLEVIQDILGKVHDRVVAISFLDTLGPREEVDVDVRWALRGEIRELRPRWVDHYLDARHKILEVFAHDEVRNL